MKISTCFIAALLTTQFPLFAQQDFFDLSIDQLMDIEFAIVSKRDESFAKSPGVISILTAEDIKSYGAKNLHDLMRLIPGFQPVHPQLHHNNSVAVRGQIAGANDKFLLILLNGKPIRDPILYGVNAPLYTGIPISAIDRIEVIRGPGSIVYGSNAFSGVMNIHTKRASTDSLLNISQQHGSYSTNSTELLLSHRLDNELNFTASLRSFNTNGWKHEFVDTTGNKDHFFNKTKGYGAFIEIDYLGLNFNWFKADLKEDATTASGVIAHVTERPSDREFISLTYEDSLFDDWLYRLSFASSASSVASLTEIDAKDENLDFTVHKAFDKISLDFGVSSRTNTLDTGTFIQQTTIDYNSVFAQVGYEFSPMFNLITGVNWLSPFNNDDLVSPRIALLGQFTEHSGYKLIYGTAYNSPTGLEQNLLIPDLFFGNPELEPSTITNFDAQIYYSDDTRFASLSVFSSTHKNVIDLANVTPSVALPKQYQNLAEAKYSGLELEGQYQITSDWRLTGSYNLQKPDKANLTSNKGVLSEQMIKLGVTYQPYEQLRAAIHNVWYDKPNNRVVQINNVNPDATNYSLLTLNVNYRFEQMFNFIKSAELNFFIDNGLNQEAIFLPDLILSNLNTMPKIAGRSYYLGLQLSF